MEYPFLRSDRLGLIHPAADVHTLGIIAIENLLQDCGYQAVEAGMKICRALDMPEARENADVLQQWIRAADISWLGISYRLDPGQGVRMVSSFVKMLRERRLFIRDGGKIKGLFFAGVLATVMSTIDSFAFAGAMNISHDIYSKFINNRSSGKYEYFLEQCYTRNDIYSSK